MTDPSLLEVNLSAIEHNLRVVRSIVGAGSAICPIVKADAYGLGAPRVARTLVAAGADMLAVYTPRQAAELLASAVGGPILVLMPVREVDRANELYRGLVCGRVHLALHDVRHLTDLVTMAERYGVVIPVHVEVDTGMSRGGCTLEEAAEVIDALARTRRLRLAGLFTHFATADTDPGFAQRQLDTFDAFLDRHEAAIPRECIIHTANSYATIRHHRFHRSMIRIGLAWAGYGIEDLAAGEIIVAAEQLRPCITWSSHLVHLKSIEPGTPVGYGSTWRARRPSVIGLVPVGYADGYPVGPGSRDARPGGARVRVVTASGGPFDVPVVGAINMDQVTLDLTDAVRECAADEIGIGTRVELVSPDPAAPNHLPRLARAAGTITHEMICRLNPRIRRVYLSDRRADETPSTPRTAAAG